MKIEIIITHKNGKEEIIDGIMAEYWYKFYVDGKIGISKNIEAIEIHYYIHECPEPIIKPIF